MFKIIKNLYIYSVISSILAFFGFKLNNEISIIGAMILSPILHPTINYLKSYKSSYYDIIIGFYTTLKISIIVFFIGTSLSIISNKLKFYLLETAIMKIRLDKRELINDFIMAIIIGFGIAYAVAENNAFAKTGLTLGITLIPVLTLGGIYFGNYIYSKYIIKSKKKKLTYNYKKNSIKLLIVFLINFFITVLIFTLTTRYIIGN